MPMRDRAPRAGLAAILVLGAARCASSEPFPAESAAPPGADAGVDAGAPAPVPATAAPDASPPLEAEPGPRFAAIYKPVFVDGGCTNGYCHGGSGSLSMRTAEAAYAALVGVRAGGADCAGAVRVVPGRPQDSLLWRKVAPGVTACGSKMPAGRESLAGPQLDLVRRWIEAGALP
jgi:hypothetical protein